MTTAAYAAARIIGVANVQALERAGLVIAFKDESVPEHQPMPNELVMLLTRAAEIFDVPIRAIIEQNRIRRVAEARHAVIAVARQQTSLSLAELGQHLGRRDHTTIIASVRQAGLRAIVDPQYAAKLAALQEAR